MILRVPSPKPNKFGGIMQERVESSAFASKGYQLCINLFMDKK